MSDLLFCFQGRNPIDGARLEGALLDAVDINGKPIPQKVPNLPGIEPHRLAVIGGNGQPFLHKVPPFLPFVAAARQGCFGAPPEDIGRGLKIYQDRAFYA